MCIKLATAVGVADVITSNTFLVIEQGVWIVWGSKIAISHTGLALPHAQCRAHVPVHVLENVHAYLMNHRSTLHQTVCVLPVAIAQSSYKSAFRLGAHVSRHVARHVLATLFNETFHTSDMSSDMCRHICSTMCPCQPGASERFRKWGYKFLRTLNNLVVKVVRLKF